ncbi:HEPN domain-containing protein [Actinoplanes sp. NPDC000266]
MRTIDQLGVFWLVTHPDEKLSGRLRFDPSGDNVRLTIVGRFVEDDEAEDETDIAIHGWAGGDPVTVDGAYRNGGSSRSRGVDETHYRANRIFVGRHLAPDDLHFETAHLELSDLNGWVGTTGLMPDRESSAEDVIYHISYRKPPSQEGTFSRGRVRISFGPEFVAEAGNQVNLREHLRFHLYYDAAQQVDSIRRDVGRLQALIILCSGSSTVLDELLLSRSDVKATMLDGSVSRFDELIELCASPVNYVAEAERKPAQAHDVLISYDELGGIEAVARWIDESTVFERPLDYLTSIMMARHMYAENRFLNVTYAAEAYHRITVGGSRKNDTEFQQAMTACLESAPAEFQSWLAEQLRHNNEPTLRRRLQQLANAVAPADRSIIADRSRWAYLTATTRNEITHIGDRYRDIEGSDLVLLAQSVYDVVRLNMLKQSGVEIDILATKSQIYPFAWYQARLAAGLDRIRRVFESKPAETSRGVLVTPLLSASGDSGQRPEELP